MANLLPCTLPISTSTILALNRLQKWHPSLISCARSRPLMV